MYGPDRLTAAKTLLRFDGQQYAPGAGKQKADNLHAYHR
jgi:hypothetical protein